MDRMLPSIGVQKYKVHQIDYNNGFIYGKQYGVYMTMLELMNEFCRGNV